MKPTNQNEAVLHYCLKNGEIDFQIAAYLGVSRLAARINEMKKPDKNGVRWKFDTRPQSGKNRYGHTYTKTIYYNPRQVV